MPVPTIDLDQKKDAIISWINQKVSQPEIVVRLKSEYGISVSLKTLKRRLRLWDVRAPGTPKNAHTSELKAQVQDLVIDHGYTDREIEQTLRRQGVQLKQRAIQRIRINLGLLKNLSAAERARKEPELRQCIQQELDSGMIESYGRRLLYVYFRTQKGVHATRDDIFRIAKELNPLGNQRRTQDMQRQRTTYSVPGPDFIWCCDGHDKLSEWGIEIYAGIDAYSRYIPWIYVGISNRKPLSVAMQYAHVVKSSGKHPNILRTDRGKETTLLGELHYGLARASKSETKLSECHFYGTSRKNVRIEQWWGQLQKSQLGRWRRYFQILSHKQLYNRSNKADRIAVLALYMPIIREETANYVRIWNLHSIRRQPNRPTIIHGKPEVNYFSPPEHVRIYGRQTDTNIIDSFLEDFAMWDLDEFLPKQTLDWVHTALRINGIILPPTGSGGAMLEDGSRLHVHAYVQLRDLIKRHMRSGEQPSLEESEKPGSGYEWLEARGGYFAGLVAENARAVEMQEQCDRRDVAEMDGDSPEAAQPAYT